MASQLEIERAVSGRWLWRFKAANGRIVSHGEEYMSRQSAENGALIGSPVIDFELTPGATEGKMRYATANKGASEGVGIETGIIQIIDNYAPDGTEGVKNRGIDVRGRSAEAVGKQLLADPNMAFAFEAGVTRDDTGHWTLDGETLHHKHPEENRCSVPECKMLMELEVEPTEPAGEGVTE